MPNSNPFSTRRLARSGLDLTVLGLGGTGPGGLFEPTARDASDAMLAAALSGEIGYADTAPFYGFGLSERILGDAFRGHDITVSTKVGRLLVPGAHPDPASFGWPEPLPFTPVFDYTHDGILRSFDDSLQRMGRDRIDILYIHDIGEMTHGADNARHLSDLRGGGLRALERLRDEGRIRAIGLGVNEVEICLELLDDAEWDVFLLAGRYTLLEQTALDALLPRCAAAGTGVVCGGPFNSGILVGGDTWNYAAAPPDIVARVDTLRAVARDHGVPLPAMALQFPLGHPSVTCVLPGPRSAEHVGTILDWARSPLPAGVWSDLRSAGALHPDAPVPDANPYGGDAP